MVPRRNPVYLKQSQDHLRRVQETFRGETGKSKAFIDVMRDFRFRKICVEEVVEKVKVIFESHDDLLLEFNRFLLDEHKIKMEKDRICRSPIDFVNSIMIRFQNNIRVRNEFLESVLRYRNRKIEFSDLSRKIAVLFEDHPDLLADFKQLSIGKEFKGKSISELDLSDRENSTPSYWLVPEFHQALQWKARSTIAAEELNNQYLCRGEEQSRGYNHKNRHQQQKMKIEDERFEMDMEIESVRSTIDRVDEYLNQIDDETGKDLKSVEDHFRALDLQCIRRSLGKKGKEMVELLRKSPMEALPGIAIRLKDKLEELLKPIAHSESYSLRTRRVTKPSRKMSKFGAL